MTTATSFLDQVPDSVKTRFTAIIKEAFSKPPSKEEEAGYTKPKELIGFEKQVHSAHKNTPHSRTTLGVALESAIPFVTDDETVNLVGIVWANFYYGSTMVVHGWFVRSFNEELVRATVRTTRDKDVYRVMLHVISA